MVTFWQCCYHLTSPVHPFSIPCHCRTSSTVLRWGLVSMYPSLSIVLSLLSSYHLISYASALPANSITSNVDPELSIQVGGVPSANLTAFGGRPRENIIWPEGHSGTYHIRFNHYKDRIVHSDGQAVVYVPTLTREHPPSSTECSCRSPKLEREASPNEMQ